MKKYHGYLITVIILSFIITAFMLKDRFSEIVIELFKAQVGYLIISLILVIIFIIFSALTLHVLVKIYKKDQSFMLSIKQWLIINFASRITPGNVGTGPTAYYLFKKEKLSSIKSAQVSLMYMAITKVPYLVIFALCIILDLIFNISSFANLYFPFIISVYFSTFLVLVTLLVLMLSSSINKFIYKLLIKFYQRFKIKHNKEVLKEKFNNYLKEGSLIFKNKQVITKSTSYYFISVIAIFSITYFAFKSIGLELGLTKFFDIFIITAYVNLLATVLPVPGGVGGFEATYYLLFKSITNNYVFITGSLILYRFFTFYLLVILGFIALSYLTKKNTLPNHD